jgi:lipoprotein-releasing system permease protein
VTLIAPQGVVTPAGVVPRLKTFTVVGLFEVGMYEYDSGLALIHLADAQRLYRMDDRVSGVRLKLDDLFKAPQVARRWWVPSTPMPSSATGRAATPISFVPCRSRRT